MKADATIDARVCFLSQKVNNVYLPHISSKILIEVLKRPFQYEMHRHAWK